MYLLDTNVLLELLLEQEHSNDVERLFTVIPADQLFITDFALYSVGIILFRRQRGSIFVRVVEDLLLEADVRLVRLNPADMRPVERVASRFQLDFDDAYQYVAAQEYGLTLVSFDSDFDRTELGRKTPAEILAATQ